jgi:hypothetical protein
MDHITLCVNDSSMSQYLHNFAKPVGRPVGRPQEANQFLNRIP